MTFSQHVHCPQCGYRHCDRIPSGYAAGHFHCRHCKLEVVIEYTLLSEVELIVVPGELRADLAPYVCRCLTDGRGLVLWADYKAVLLAR